MVDGRERNQHWTLKIFNAKDYTNQENFSRRRMNVETSKKKTKSIRRENTKK